MSEPKELKLTVMLSQEEMWLLKRLAASEHAGLSHTIRQLIHRAHEDRKKAVRRAGLLRQTAV